MNPLVDFLYPATLSAALAIAGYAKMFGAW